MTVGVWVVIDMEYKPKPKMVFASASIDIAHGYASEHNREYVLRRFRVYALSGSITLRKP